MSEFRFAEPGWVHLIWAVLCFVIALYFLERRGSDALDQLVGPSLRDRLVRAPAGWRRVARIALLGLAGLCLVLALMRPQAGMRQVATPQVGAELMIALDVSRSMLAEDAVPNRLERAKAEIVDLLGYLEGDQVGLVAFAGRASVLSPLTPDFGFLRLVLETAGPGSVTRGGTRLAEPIHKALEGFGEPSGATRVILLITDGEDHDSFAMDAAQEAADAGVAIIAIGFGDENGSEIYVTDPRTGARELVRDADGRPVRSRLDGALLREIALTSGGAYVPAETGVLDLESIYATHIAGLTRGALDARGRTVRDEVYGWFVLGALVFLIASAGVAAGPAVVCALLCLVVVAPAPPLHAAEGEAESAAAADAPSESPEKDATASEGFRESPEDAPSSLTPRERFNAGAIALAAGDLETAERNLTRAHTDAGDDAELRFRARYDLGYALVQRAGRIEAEQPDAALADLYRAADWFREAIAIRPEHEDARVNLELSLRRALLLADRLAREREGGLEDELAALATRQREIAVEIVRLHALTQADPSPDAGERLRDEYRNAALSERVLLSDADALAARSGEEQAALETRDESELSPEDSVRRVQLEGVLHYLHRGRERMGQTRSQLRERQGERAYRRAAAALTELERAIDQLRDPVRVLDRLLREQGELTRQTQLVLAAAGGLLGDDTGPLPVSINAESTTDAQGALVERVRELGLRFRAGLEANPAEAADPEQANLLAAVSEAAPLVESAVEHLRAAYTALDGGVLEQAPPGQLQALEKLAAARERFLDVKGLIEAAYLEEQRIAALLEGADADALREALTPLREAQARNQDRAERLGTQLERERDSEANAETDEEGNPARERTELALQLLQLAVGAMRDVDTALGNRDAPASSARFEPARAAARDALERLEILRRLYLSIAEQVRDVAERQLALQDQSRDAEAQAASGAADPSAGARLGEVQEALAERTLGLAEGMAEQSSEAAGADDPAAAQSADALRLAAEHVLVAEGAMREAHGELRAEPSAFASARAQQEEALKELAEALALLQPPQQQDQQDPQQQEGEGEQQPQEGGGQQQEAAESEPQGADPGQLLQGVRDREAQRQRERARRGTAPEATVEKDW